MITEDYCSFEIAKLLKEKGFNNPCLRVYDNKGIICIRYTGFDVPHDYFNRQLYLCPTHQMAMKWLRKVHLQHIQISYLHGAYHEYEYAVINTFNGKAYHEPVSFSSYEEAVEAACIYVLKNLI